MNDFDLEAKLKSVPLPERAKEYWENFPTRVRWQLHRAAPKSAIQENGWVPFAWKMSAGSIFADSARVTASARAVVI